MLASTIRNAWFWLATSVACYFALSFYGARSDLIQASERRPFCVEVGAVDNDTGRALDGFHVVDAGNAALTDFQAMSDPVSRDLRMRILGVGCMPLSLTMERDGYWTSTRSISDPFPTAPVIFQMKRKTSGEPGATDNPDDAQ